jgi:tRNA dimethylallyltransferase
VLIRVRCTATLILAQLNQRFTEQQSIPHYLIDICNPTHILTVADYQHQAQALIASPLVSLSPCPPFLLVGGTGLYIRSVVRGLKIPRVAPHKELRIQLESLGQSQLYAMLQQVDPVATQKIHPNDLVRTLRALEVFTSLVVLFPSNKESIRPIIRYFRLA